MKLTNGCSTLMQLDEQSNFKRCVGYQSQAHGGLQLLRAAAASFFLDARAPFAKSSKQLG